MAEVGVGSRELVDRIWNRVALREAISAEPKVLYAPNFPKLHDDSERHLVNRRCVFDRSPANLGTAGRLGLLKRPLKARAARFVIAVLDRYFADEEVFIQHLVRFQNNVAEEHDRLASDLTDFRRAVRGELELLRRHITLLQEAVQEGDQGLERVAAAVDGLRQGV